MQQNKDAIFISIHQNKFSSDSVCGLQTFFRHGDDVSKSIAEHIQSYVARNLQKNNNRLAKADTRKVYLIENAPIPTVFVECGFLSNYNDLSNLKTEDYRYSVAFCIASGIVEYFNERG